MSKNHGYQTNFQNTLLNVLPKDTKTSLLPPTKAAISALLVILKQDGGIVMYPSSFRHKHMTVEHINIATILIVFFVKRPSTLLAVIIK